MIAGEKKQAIRSEAGFTLLEMIIAVTLVALMAVALWAAFRISIRSWSRGTEFMDTNQRHRSILDMVRKQLASTYGLYTPIDLQQGGTSYVIFSGNATSIQFVSLNSLQFQESPGLTLVYYEVVRDSEGDFTLVEKEAPYTGQLPDQKTAENLSRATPIFGKLVSCTFDYFDPGDNENPSQWVKEWDGQDKMRLPVAISLSMESRDSRGNSLNRHMVVPVQAQLNTLINPVNPFLGRRAVMR